ncbi:alpha/beta fold hydrolase [Kordiimonas aquimaris]|uniref:alpha/beta fold hydrolase n=1 Tax=Kordiimonas aquimaris TaxID=707591 RepID=UPI0021CE7CFB|nr:alpha/beta fold hydrolase [Kordiimonas aquimaris]
MSYLLFMYRLSLLILSMVVTQSAFAEAIEIQMKDGHTLVANVTTPKDSNAAVLLMHQCNRDQTMWSPVVRKLNMAGIGTMTVDFRGYGQSKSDAFDIEASYEKSTKLFSQDIGQIYGAWVRHTQGVTTRGVGGASCGGGMAALLASQNREIKALMLFSAALRPYWFPEENWKMLNARHQLPVLGIVSIDDRNALGQKAIIATERVVNGSKSKHTQFIRYGGRLHGQPLLIHDPTLPDVMTQWFVRALK